MVMTRNQARDGEMADDMRTTHLGSRLSKSMEVIFGRLMEPQPQGNSTETDKTHALLNDGWDHPDAWAPGNPAIDASPLLPLIVQGREETGFPDDPYPDTFEELENEDAPLNDEEYTDLQNLAILFRKEALCQKKLKFCNECETKEVAGIVKAGNLEYKSPSGVIPPVWLLEIGELIWKDAARKWQGLVAAQLRSETIYIRSFIIGMKLHIKERYPQKYKMITKHAYREAMELMEARRPKIPPTKRLYIANSGVILLDYLKGQEGTSMTDEESERVRICMNQKNAAHTEETRMGEAPRTFVLPPPLNETTSTEAQSEDESQPPCGQQTTMAQTPQEEERMLYLSQGDPPSPQEQNIDRITECHIRIDSVVKAVERMETILAQGFQAAKDTPPPLPPSTSQAPKEQRTNQRYIRKPTTETTETSTEQTERTIEKRCKSIGTYTNMGNKKKTKQTQTKNDKQFPPRRWNRRNAQERFSYEPWERNNWGNQYQNREPRNVSYGPRRRNNWEHQHQYTEPRSVRFTERNYTPWRMNHRRPTQTLDSEERPQRWQAQQRQQPQRWIPQNRWSFQQRGNTQWDQEQQGGRAWQERSNGNWGWRW